MQELPNCKGSCNLLWNFHPVHVDRIPHPFQSFLPHYANRIPHLYSYSLHCQEVHRTKTSFVEELFWKSRRIGNVRSGSLSSLPGVSYSFLYFQHKSLPGVSYSFLLLSRFYFWIPLFLIGFNLFWVLVIILSIYSLDYVIPSRFYVIPISFVRIFIAQSFHTGLIVFGTPAFKVFL